MSLLWNAKNATVISFVNTDQIRTSYYPFILYLFDESEKLEKNSIHMRSFISSFFIFKLFRIYHSFINIIRIIFNISVHLLLKKLLQKYREEIL